MMKKNLVLLLFSFFPLLGLAQTNLVAQKFEQYRNTVLQEKIFLRTDRPAYVDGEIIWFKVYAVDATFNKPLAISKVAYVELLNQNNAPVLQAKIELNKGLGAGSLQIPKETPSGYYRLRAYTNWMKNFDQSFFYDQALKIVNADAVPAQVIVADDYDIQFFPEGGRFIAGVKNKIAFKILNQKGIGEDLKGAIVNAKNDTLAKIAATKYGMGSFSIEGKTNENLTAIFKTAKGQIFKKALPTVESTGLAMQLVRSANGSITVNLMVKNYNTKSLRLFCHTRNQININQVQPVVNEMASFTFNERDLKEGISQLTIFDEFNKPLSERLYFKKPTNPLQINASVDHSQYGNRMAVNLSLEAQENASLSVSVFKADSLNAINGGSLFSYLWLSSELKGNIENPAYYFAQGDENLQAIDNLMLTQGWRRFNWAEVMQNFVFNPVHAPEMKGMILNTQLNTAKKLRTFATVVDTVPKNYFSITDANGNSSFMSNFYGKKTLILQTDPLEDSVSKFTIISPFIANHQAYKNRLLLADDFNTLMSRDRSAQVQSKFYTAQYQAPKQDTIGIGAAANISYNIADYTKFPNIQETVKEYVKGLSTYKKGGNNFFRISYKNDFNNINYMYDRALVLFDGIPDFNTDDILAIKTVNIDQISMVQEKYFDNDINMGGVLMINSKTKNLAHFKSPNALISDDEGYQEQRVFYSPKYLTAADKTSTMPDFRSLLYWNPEVAINPNTSAKLNFYTGDETGKYIGLIEGLTVNGKAGLQLISFEVKK